MTKLEPLYTKPNGEKAGRMHGCPLWPFRLGTHPWREGRKMTAEQREAAIKRLRPDG